MGLGRCVFAGLATVGLVMTGTTASWASPGKDVSRGNTVTCAALDPGRAARRSIHLEDGALGTDVQVLDAAGPCRIEYQMQLPAGYSMKSMGKRVVIKDRRGQVWGYLSGGGAYDDNGNELRSSLRVENGSVRHDLQVAPGFSGVVFMRVAVQRVANGDDQAINRNIDEKLQNPGSSIETRGGAFVGIPAGYIYDLNHPRRGLHDYCTKSPDSYFNADFRGPCARHDMAYERAGTRDLAADYRLKPDLETNCAFAYGKYNPVRYSCYGMAETYFRVVSTLTYAQIVAG